MKWFFIPFVLLFVALSACMKPEELLDRKKMVSDTAIGGVVGTVSTTLPYTQRKKVISKASNKDLCQLAINVTEYSRQTPFYYDLEYSTDRSVSLNVEETGEKYPKHLGFENGLDVGFRFDSFDIPKTSNVWLGLVELQNRLNTEHTKCVQQKDDQKVQKLVAERQALQIKPEFKECLLKVFNYAQNKELMDFADQLEYGLLTKAPSHFDLDQINFAERYELNYFKETYKVRCLIKTYELSRENTVSTVTLKEVSRLWDKLPHDPKNLCSRTVVPKFCTGTYNGQTFFDAMINATANRVRRTEEENERIFNMKAKSDYIYVPQNDDISIFPTKPIYTPPLACNITLTGPDNIGGFASHIFCY